jgi:hypothetical protein
VVVLRLNVAKEGSQEVSSAGVSRRLAGREGTGNAWVVPGWCLCDVEIDISGRANPRVQMRVRALFDDALSAGPGDLIHR